MSSITILNHWTLKRQGYSDVEIRALSDGSYQMLGYRSIQCDERWFNLNFTEDEILRYVELYGKDVWQYDNDR